MAKDRIKPLFAILASGDAARLREAAALTIREIQDEQNELNRDIRLIRDLVNRYGGPADGLTSRERSAKVREAALALVERGATLLTPQQVVDYLGETEGITFDVKRPASVVATILRRLPQFKHLEKNQFQFVGHSQQQS